MYKGKIIDTHAHIYPEKVANKAVHNIENFYSIHAESDGTPAKLSSVAKELPFEKFLVHSTATKVEQVHNINNFVADQLREYENFIGFGTLHFDMSAHDVLAELDRVMPLGICGIKLHPDCQHFYIDDPKMDTIYSACQDNFLPILIHTGDERYNTSRPERLARTARRFSSLRFIAAHFGGYSCWDSLGCYEGLSNVWFDTSSSLFKMEPDQPERLIEMLGQDRFFFGTDYPLFSHEKELERFYRLNLSDDLQEKILYRNAAEFFHLL